ncbi:MAG: polysaccharide pyruvyl transferase CsaB [Synechococcales cyanobacterium RM1_1_8]|nr:polysaccharide pyruvyl transferase CsaB [Synechococcales cyanobacterium RM1_1_8]
MRVVLCGYYGKGNGGDEALLATLLQMLPEQATPIVLSGDVERTRQQYGVEVCDRTNSFALLSTLGNANAFIFGGGSLIQDASSALSPLYYCGLMGLAQQFGLITLAWSQGVGPLQRPLTRWLARQAFQKCDGVSVRDGGSAQQLKAWNVDCLLAPDPVWALDGIDCEPLKLPSPRIAVCLRAHPSLTPARLARLIQALGKLQQRTDAGILLLPFQPSQDRAIAEQIQQSLPGPCQLLEISDPRYLKGIFRQVDLTLSMRLHGLIMAAAEGCRCHALSYDPKIDRLMEDLSLPGWSLEALPDSAEAIAEAWTTEFHQGQSLGGAQIQSLRDRALMHRDLLHQALAAG